MRRIRGEAGLLLPLLLLMLVAASLPGLGSAFLLPGPARTSSPSSVGAREKSLQWEAWDLKSCLRHRGDTIHIPTYIHIHTHTYDMQLDGRWATAAAWCGVGGRPCGPCSRARRTIQMVRVCVCRYIIYIIYILYIIYIYIYMYIFVHNCSLITDQKPEKVDATLRKNKTGPYSSLYFILSIHPTAELSAEFARRLEEEDEVRTAGELGMGEMDGLRTTEQILGWFKG
jgi:hypothetical protein